MLRFLSTFNSHHPRLTNQLQPQIEQKQEAIKKAKRDSKVVLSDFKKSQKAECNNLKKQQAQDLKGIKKVNKEETKQKKKVQKLAIKGIKGDKVAVAMKKAGHKEELKVLPSQNHRFSIKTGCQSDFCPVSCTDLEGITKRKNHTKKKGQHPRGRLQHEFD